MERYKRILGENYKILEKKEFPAIWNLRVNTLKIEIDDLIGRFERKGFEIEQIPWIKEGFWVKGEENVSKTIEHVLGYFFIQSSSSMIPPLILDPKPGDVVLDLCASPGAKTTQMAAMMKNEGVIIANDVHYKRLKALRGNLQRCGVLNTIITLMRGEKFWRTGLKFDKILLDVPCTGTGTLNPRIFEEASLSALKMLSGIQRKLLASAAKCLKPGGVIVYSTCSLEPEENEENIDFAVRRLGLKTEEIEINAPQMKPLLEWNGREYDASVANAIRIVPSEKTEGFFICKLRK